VVALPITLETALGMQGYTIDPVEATAFTITLPNGVFSVPAMVRSKLTWQYDTTEALGDDLWLSKVPLFSDDYRPVLMSHILDRYRTRRLGYNTPGEWRLAFRRWCNLNMAVPNQRYISAAVDMPLDDRDETDQTDRTLAATSHGLDIGSDFPQSLVSGNTDYATNASDRRTADNTDSGETARRTGRSQSIMQLLEAQRAAYINVDAEILDSLDTLFLGVFDRGEGNPRAQYGLPADGVQRLNW